MCMQSNDFFALFLDSTMSYSSGIFKVCQSCDLICSLVSYVDMRCEYYYVLKLAYLGVVFNGRWRTIA